jgi:transposase InsO family protein
VLPLPDCDQLHAFFRDPMQRRYAIIRPLILFHERTATQRAEETHPPPETVGTLKRRCEQQGMLGLFPDAVEIVPAGSRHRVSDAVVQELQRLKGLYDGFPYRALVRIIHETWDDRMGDPTVKRLWHQLPGTAPPQLPLLDSHRYPERSQARVEVIQRSFQGWSTTSIRRVLHVSRPTLNAWIGRFERDHLASLADKSSAPTPPGRKAWLPVMHEMYPLQKPHPDAGGFRMWRLRGTTDLSVRTVERIMAVNRQVYDAIPPGGRQRTRKTEPPLHPFKASGAHEYGFLDGRIMDVALAGVTWWSLIVLEGSSRTMLAGAVAPTEASWVALMVLYTACVRYGAPDHVLSDTGGASISKEVEAVCKRLGIDHHTMVSPQGASDMNLMETHFHSQRRLSDDQFSLTQTPVEFEQAHQRFLQLSNTTAHQGLRKEKFARPIPLDVVGEARGRL